MCAKVDTQINIKIERMMYWILIIIIIFSEFYEESCLTICRLEVHFHLSKSFEGVSLR